MEEENKIKEEEIKNDDKEENLPMENEEETMSESIKKIEKPSIGILIFFIVISFCIVGLNNRSFRCGNRLLFQEANRAAVGCHQVHSRRQFPNLHAADSFTRQLEDRHSCQCVDRHL